MIRLADIVRAAYGAWRLARLDPAGMNYFDTTIAGFWRSFWAAAVVAPPYFFLVSFRVDGAQDGFVHAWLSEFVAYAIGWTAFPVAALYLTEAFDCGKRYLPYIVAYNWAAIVQVSVDLVATLIAWLVLTPDFVPEEVRVVFVIAITAALWFYQYFIARTALNVPGPVAMAIVACDILIGYVLKSAMDYVHSPLA
jgi:hypothetical protein